MKPRARFTTFQIDQIRALYTMWGVTRASRYFGIAVRTGDSLGVPWRRPTRATIAKVQARLRAGEAVVAHVRALVADLARLT